MEARFNYILLGLFAVLSLAALVGFVFWAGKYDRNLGAYRVYYLYNKELPKGILVETPVRYLGLPVGFVKSYGLNNAQDKVEIIIWIKKEITLHQGTYAVVESQGLTGGNYIALIQGKGLPFPKESQAVLEFQENWIEKVESKAEMVFDRLEVSLNRLNMLLSKRNLENVETALENITEASSQFNTALNHLNRVLVGAEDTLTQIRTSSTLVNESLMRGDYNLRAILTPLLNTLEQNSKHLNRILEQTEAVVEDFSTSPSEFLFGKQKRDLGPRE